MSGPLQAQVPASARGRRAWLGAMLAAATVFLAACSGLPSVTPPPQATAAEPPPTIGTGQVKVALILPLTAPGNVGLAAQSMKNAAEMALAEFNSPNIQLLVKDDGGTPSGAQQAAAQAIDEGAEIIVGPLLAQTVGPVGQIARSRGIRVIAFSTDSNVAARGVFLLSFMPESDVDRIVDYAVANGKRSFVALMPENAYGSVIEGEFKQVVARRGARIVALERYPLDRAAIGSRVKVAAQAATRADAIFIPDGADAVPTGGADAGGERRGGAADPAPRHRLVGRSGDHLDPALHGAWFAGPDPAGYRSFVGRYRSRFGQDPVRTATLSYDAVALVAALVKTQGTQRFTDEVLLNPSGFAGIDGIFRFRPDGTNQRGLAIMRVTGSGPQVINPPPRSFGASGT